MRNIETDKQHTAVELSRARARAGLSQADMAKALDKSLATIRNWETGYIAPDFPHVLQWAEVCGENLVQFLIRIINPKAAEGLRSANTQEKLESMDYYWRNVATEHMIDEFGYIMSEATGSDWVAQLELIVAYDHCPLRSRINIANDIITNFKLAEAAGTIIEKDAIMPNIPLLEHATSEAFKAVLEGKTHYTLH